VRTVTSWFAIGFSSAEATNARFIRCAATGLNLREREVADLRVLLLRFVVALFVEVVFFDEDFDGVLDAGFFFAADFVVVVSDFLSLAGVAASCADAKPAKESKRTVIRTRFRKYIFRNVAL
jgi:hypothetical protein